MSNNSSIITNNTNSNNNQHQQHHNSRISNGTQACAACKYRRRKCASDCVLAPYFPHDRQREFLNAHKLFGVSNITKIIRDLNPAQKDMAMQTIIFQSNTRAQDPVGGCYRMIRDLRHQIAFYEAELDLVLRQLQLCKAQFYQQQQHAAQLYQTLPETSTQVVEAHTPTGDHHQNNELMLNADNYQQYQAMMRCYYYDEAEQGNNNEQRYLPVSHQHGTDDQNNDQFSWVASADDEAVLASSNSSTSHGECFVMKSDFGGECLKTEIQIDGNGAPFDEERDFASKFDDCSTHVEVHVSCCHLQDDGIKFDPQLTAVQLSEEVVALKEEKIVLGNSEDESFHHISEHDLRNAATLFTLTN